VAPPSEIDALRELLADAGRAPADTVAALAACRRGLTTADGDSLEVARQELQFLLRQSQAPGASVELRRAVLRARREMASVELAALRRRPEQDPAVLFDLAELAAECEACGFDEEAREVESLIEQRLALVSEGADPALGEEARERWAALASSEDEVPLRHKVLLLERSADAMGGLADRTKQRLFRKLEGRLRRLGNEIGLQ